MLFGGIKMCGAHPPQPQRRSRCRSRGAAVCADIAGFMGTYGDGFVCVPRDKGTALRARFKNENISEV